MDDASGADGAVTGDVAWREAGGPYFEDLSRGMAFGAPVMTLSSGLAASHQAIVGDRLRLSLDDELARRVVGAAPLAHPALVWDVAIGQSTVATHHVRANLFYRGVVLRRLPVIGDSLRTTTTVAALRRNRPRPGRAPTGLAVLRITTADQLDRPVLDFWRCAMIPLRAAIPAGDRDGAGAAGAGPADDLDAVGAMADLGALPPAIAEWDLAAFRSAGGGTRPADVAAGRGWRVAGGDVVSSAPELARLTLNIASVHHDRAAGSGRRLVYGGHTIGLALSQACRALPDLITVAGWHGCDHLGPVFEGDTLTSTVAVERVDPLETGGCLVHLRSRVAAWGPEAGPGEDARRDVLDWRFVGVLG